MVGSDCELGLEKGEGGSGSDEVGEGKGGAFFEELDAEGAANPDEEINESEVISDLKDQLLRRAAELENLKRRTVRDVEKAHKFGSEKLINDLFPVLDSLEKAIESAALLEGGEVISEGVELSLKLFLEAVSKSGVLTIDPLGEPFDPTVHEALAAVPNENAEPNTVMEVIQKGYSLNERLVRAARVIVVKGL